MERELLVVIPAEQRETTNNVTSTFGGGGEDGDIEIQHYLNRSERRRHGGSGSKDKLNVSSWFGKYSVYATKKNIAISVLVLAIGGIILFEFGHSILTVLKKLLDSRKEDIKNAGTLSGTVILAFLVFVTTIPIMVGYSVALYYCGYVFGFPFGWIPAFLGAFAGAFLVFLGIRSFTPAMEYTRRRYKQVAIMKGISRAVERKGFTMIWLIRISPWPFGLVTSVMATIPNLDIYTHLFATALALPKTLLHVYIGSRLTSLSEGFSNNSNSTRNNSSLPNDHDRNDHDRNDFVISLLPLILAVCIFIISTIYIGKVVQKAMDDNSKEDGNDEENQEEKNGYRTLS